MSTFKGKRVLITGGASGIGKLMGGMALDKGAAALVIWDIDQESIESVVRELGKKSKAQGRAGRVYGMRVDVSNQAMVADRYEQTKNYCMVSPYRWTFGATFTIGKTGILPSCQCKVESNRQ